MQGNLVTIQGAVLNTDLTITYKKVYTCTLNNFTDFAPPLQPLLQFCTWFPPTRSP